MTLRRSLYPWLASGLLLGGMMVLAIIAFVPQDSADVLSYLGLTFGLALATSSFTAFLGLEIRRLGGVTLSSRVIRQALRQGSEVGLVVVAGSALWVLTGLSWWELALLVAAIGSFELAIAFRRPHEVGGLA